MVSVESKGEDLRTYLASLQPQRLILRSVNEVRPVPSAETAHGVVVGRVSYVEVVSVQGRSLVSRRFEGVAATEAAEAARNVGHTVIERSGNIT